MTMNGLTRVALAAALAMMTAAPLTAAEPDAPSDTEIYVVNNHLADVRIFAEDAEGRLYNLGRVARGALRSIEVPASVATAEYRIKVFPATPAWSPIPDDFGIKTSPLDNDRDRTVTMWLEADLTQSVVEIDRG
jgi:hypothetical protein